MTTASLKDKRVRDLARLAKQHGVSGWHAMRKDQLIKALVRKAKGAMPPTPGDRESRPGQAVAAAAHAPSCDPRVAARIAEARDRLSRAKDLATRPELARGARPAWPWGRNGTPPGPSSASFSSTANSRTRPPSGWCARSRSTAA